MKQTSIKLAKLFAVMLICQSGFTRTANSHEDKISSRTILKSSESGILQVNDDLGLRGPNMMHNNMDGNLWLQDSIKTYNILSPTDSAIARKIISTFDEYGRRSTYRSFGDPLPGTNQWRYLAKYEYEWDDVINEKVIRGYWKDTSMVDWMYDWLDSTRYNAAGEIVYYRTYNLWMPGDPLKGTMARDCEYNLENDLILKTNYSWNDSCSCFLPSNREEYQYNIDSKLAFVTKYWYDKISNKWVKGDMVENVYNDDGLLERELVYVWEDFWSVDSKTEYVYNPDKKIQSEKKYSWNSDHWDESLECIYTYDTEGNYECISSSKQGDGIWVNQRKEEFGIRPDGGYYRICEFEWDNVNQIWIGNNNRRHTRIYDEISGLLTSFKNSRWDNNSGSWKQEEFQSREYDSYGNPECYLSYYWSENSNSWILYHKELYYYSTLASKNANLSTLALSEGSLTPEFSETVISYNALLSEGSNNSPIVTFATANQNATVEVRNAQDVTSLVDSLRTTTVRVTAENGIDHKTYSILFNISTDAHDQKDDAGIVAYPNPFTTYLTIRIPGAEKNPVSIRLFDLAGKNVFSVSNINDQEYILDRGNLKEGIYLLEIFGETVWKKRIMVQ